MSVHQGGMEWNGTSWVPSGSGTTSSFSNYTYTQKQPQQTAAPSFPTGMSAGLGKYENENPVEQYSRYYQYWIEQAKIRKQEAAMLPPGAQKDEAVRVASWAEYYATQSAHAAHYYNNQINHAKSQAAITPASASSTSAFVNESSNCLKASDGLSKNVSSKPLSHQQNLDKYEKKKEKYSSPSLTRASSYSNGKTAVNSSGTRPKQNDTDYTKSMPVNDSYYGRSSDNNSVRSNLKTEESQDIKISPPPKKQKVSSKHIAVVNKPVSSKKIKEGFERSRKVLEKRADRFSGEGGLSKSTVNVSEKGSKMGQYMGLSVIGGSKKKALNGKSAFSSSGNNVDFEKMTVKGTCQKLEKEYLRLTAPPRANLVRPLHILKQHVQNLKKRWSQRADYDYMCSQLKAVRQDLMVQRINNPFAVQVYEMHARVALEEDDLNEYNQCQSQLEELYEMLERHYTKTDLNCFSVPGLENENEFIAYRIIYYVYLTGNKKYEGGSSDLFKIMLHLSKNQKKFPCIVHALKVREAVAENDYHTFFRLHESCPNMGAYLMDYLVPGMRLYALSSICKAYRPSISAKYVLSTLGFDAENTEDFQLGLKWIRGCGGVLSGELDQLLTKESFITQALPKVKNSLI